MDQNHYIYGYGMLWLMAIVIPFFLIYSHRVQALLSVASLGERHHIDHMPFPALSSWCTNVVALSGITTKRTLFLGDSKRKPGQWYNDGQGTFPFESKERCAAGQCFWDELLVWASWIRKWQPKMCKRELTFLEKENAVRMHQEEIVSPRPASATTNEFGGNISLLLNNFLFRCTNSSDVPKPVVATTTTTDYSHCTTTYNAAQKDDAIIGDPVLPFYN